MASWRRNITSGLITLGPLLIIIYLVYRLYSIIGGLTPVFLLDPDVLRLWIPGDSNQAVQRREQLAHFLRVICLLVVLFTFSLSVGYLMRTTLGGFIERIVDNVANRVPGLRIVYNASKIAAETTLGDNKSLQTPARVETWDDHRMTAFKTGKKTADGREVLFLPTAPNFTSGFMIEVEPDRITETDENVEEALTRVLSAGFGGENNGSQTGHGARSDFIDKQVVSNDTDEKLD